MFWPDPVSEPEATPTPPVNIDTSRDLIRESREDLASIEFIPTAGSNYSFQYDPSSGEIELNATDAIFYGYQPLMHNILSRVINLTNLNKVTESADDSQLSMFGLDEPVMTVRLNRTDGTSHEIEVGDVQAAGQGRYARNSGSREVFLLNEVQGMLLTLELEDIYDISFFPIMDYQDDESAMMFIDHVLLESQGSVLEFFKRMTDEDWEDVPIGSSSYRLLQPVSADSNDFMIQSLILEKIIYLEPGSVVTVRPSDLSQYGLDDPARLTVTALDWTGTLLIGGRDYESDGRFVMLEGHDAVLLDTVGDYSFLNVSLSQIRSSIIWLHNIGNVSSVTFDLDGITRVLRLEHSRSGDDLRGWLDDKMISDTNARRLYLATLMIHQSGFTDAPVPQNESPVYTITIQKTSGETDKLELYRISDSQFLIAQNGASTLCFVTRMSLQQNLLSRFEILDAGGDIPN